ncbi:hypothetical protein Sjap_013057 [Stephania japonica]|uniref:Protein kinase domain-containing protein n=1 Tax=Stephania japonica TaxID=461633 RepID=A0AAP0IY03_9MAGN
MSMAISNTTTTFNALFFFFSVVNILIIIISSSSSSSATAVVVDEQQVLLTFKASIEDPTSSLSSTWSNTSHTHLCNWTGITCSTSPTTPFLSITSLNLQGLNLSGTISPSICQLPTLTHLILSQNHFNHPIPLHLSQCTSLERLNLSDNLIWGTIPDQISLLKSLRVLDLSGNNIEGRIPDGLGGLKNLQVLDLGRNLFSGTLSSSVFGNFSELLLLDLSENPLLVSEIPSEIGKLGKLQQIFLQRSGFVGSIPDSFVGLVGLEVLDISSNNLTGEIPRGFGLALHNLASLDVSQNKLIGPFPTGICNGKQVINLNFHSNFFNGSLTESFEECLKLESFQVQNNGFHGDFPNGLWTLPKIKLIRAGSNRFSGEIPDSIRAAKQIEQIQIDNNSFTGRVPVGLGLLRSLYRFSASLNSFYGELPENICDSPAMSILDLSHNSFSGRIPEFKQCRRLVSVSLADNSLSGNIPNSLAELPVLTYLDLSRNNLTGLIPPELQNLKLALFNVSFNRLSGEVPTSLISGLPASFLQGNPDLCGQGLPRTCSVVENKQRSIQLSKTACALISVAFAIGLVLVSFGFFSVYKWSKKKSGPGGWNLVLFYPLRITESDFIMGMNEKSDVGHEGIFGGVNVTRLRSGEFIAVKKLMNSGSLSIKSLKADIKILAKIRHKNIAKVLGFCYSEDSIFLIYEFVQNGSLQDVVRRLEVQLPWNMRLQIALGAAQGLAYLHKDYVPRLLHRNVKSANILLDSDFAPKLTHFALDRVVGEHAFESTIASEFNSSCYIAPEFGYNKKATEQMDVYSFGVVLLELVTGRQDQLLESQDSVDILTWVRRKINTTNGPLQVLDPKISGSSQEAMLGALDIALQCTSVLPEKRPTIFEVVRSLQILEG